MEQANLTKLEIEQQIRTNLDKFTNINVVDKIKVGRTRACVNYTTGLRRFYRINEFDPRTMWLHPIQIGNEFTVFPGQEHLQKFFNISQFQFERAGSCDKEIAIQQLVTKLLNEGWVDTEYPYHILKSDWESIESNYLINNTLTLCPAAYSKTFQGWHLQSTFYKYSDQRGIVGRTYREIWNDSRFLYHMIVKLIESGRDVTRTNLIRVMNSTNRSYKNRIGRKFRPPGFYMALFKMLGLEYKSIHDSYPMNWSKAIAATKLKMHYTFQDSNADHVGYNNFIDSIDEISNVESANLYDVEADVLMLDDNMDTNIDAEPYLNLLGKRFKMIIAMNKIEGIPVAYFDNQRPISFLKIYK